MNEYSAGEAHRLWSDGSVSLIDVREVPEHEACRVSGVALIPMSELPSRIAEIPTGRPLVVMCRSGQRSARVVEYLGEVGFPDEAINLEGGIIGWAASGLPYEGEPPR